MSPTPTLLTPGQPAQASASPTALERMAQTRESLRRTCRATCAAVIPESAITRTWASNRAVKWEFGRTSQGMRAVATPSSGQSTRGTAQCVDVH